VSCVGRTAVGWWDGATTIVQCPVSVKSPEGAFNEKNPSQKKEEMSYKGVVHVVTLPILHVWLSKLAVFRGRPSRIDRQKV